MSPTERPLALSENQMSAILAASYPLPADRRSEFLVDIARELAALSMLGDGVLHRTIMTTQKKYFAPPILDGDHTRGHHKSSGGRPHAGKYA
jgi:hypothetical protein